MDIDLDNLIVDTFKDVFCDIVTCNVDRAILKGGRSSTKSQTVGDGLVVGCMTYHASAVCCVRYGNKIEERLVNTIKEAIRFLGVEKYWKLRKSPFEYVLLDYAGRETDVSIKFTGCDNPDNVKSFKPRRGAFRYIWFEELTNFDSLKEVNSLIQTFARGEGEHCVIMTYNPPMSTSNWVNDEYEVACGKVLGHSSNSVYSEFEFEVDGLTETVRQVVHHSTYLDVIESGHSDWLGKTFIGEAKQAEKENNEYYRWAYLGEVIGTQANVFHNIRDWDGDTSKLDLGIIYRGFDIGYGGPDPSAYVECYYDRENKSLYILNEFGRPKMSIDEIVAEMKRYNPHNFPINADNACPLLIDQIVNKGINISRVKKSPNSVMGGVGWLRDLNCIYISSLRTPDAYREFKGYSYVVDKQDTVTSSLSDKDNHRIDAIRYALKDVIKYSS